MKKLTEDEIQQKLLSLNGWQIKNNKLFREYEFANFIEALGFMNQLSQTINKLNHHPDWSNSYNKVSISLSTHSAGGITDLDFKLAQAAQKNALKYKAS